MGVPIFVARLRVTNGGGTFDSLSHDPIAQPRIVFTATRSLGSTPNSATIGIYNLADDTIAKIRGVVTTRIDWTPAERAELLAAGASAQPVEITSDGYGLAAVTLSWGYMDSERPDIEAALRIGFVGQSTDIRLRRDGNNKVLTFEVSDGGALLGAAEAVALAGGGPTQYRSKSYAPGTEAVDVIADLINACGLSVDRAALQQQLQSAMLARGLPLGDLTMSGGYTSSGPSLPLLEQFLRSLDLRWSVQAGELLILAPDGVIPGLDPLRLSSEAGNIVGQPEPFEGTRLGISTWANAEAVPGRQVDVSTSTIRAGYVLDEISTSADTRSGGVSELKLNELQTISGVF